MNAGTKSLTAALLLSGGFVAVLTGLKVREAQDLRQTLKDQHWSTLLASRSDKREIAESDYFRSVTEILKAYYVEDIESDAKLLSGAVRGMIAGLRDVDSRFFSKEEFAAFKKMRQGMYEGIGVYLDFEGGSVLPPQSEEEEAEAEEEGDLAKVQLPRLTVVALTPNGPAAKAGIQEGDVINSLDDHWVYNSQELLKFTEMRRQWQAKKLTFEELNKERLRVRTLLDKSVMPVRARERLTVGASGSVKLRIERKASNGKPQMLNFTVEKGPSEMPGFLVKGNEVRLPLYGKVDEALKTAIQGKSEVTIDLRNNVLGDHDTMRRCLEVLVPAGKYGEIVSERARAALPLEVKKGNASPPKLKLIVDASTRDAAEQLATALSAFTKAKVTGGMMGRQAQRVASGGKIDLAVTELVQLPDGSGYSLAIGGYRASNTPSGQKAAEKKAGSKAPVGKTTQKGGE